MAAVALAIWTFNPWVSAGFTAGVIAKTVFGR